MVLSGLECSDGYFRNKYQEYSTVSESLAAGVFRIALNCGYTPAIRRAVNRAKDNLKPDSTSIIIGYPKVGVSKSGAVRSIKSYHGNRSQRVYDLTVEAGASFVVGSAIVHNCHRIGQKDNVLVQHFVVEGSLDANMAKKIVAKQEMADKVLDVDLNEVIKIE